MPFQLGVVTRWHAHEAAEAAIMLAETAQSDGYPVSILARQSCHRAISAYWDNKVVDERRSNFIEWALGCDRIIWTSTPSFDEVSWASHRSIEAVVLPSWDELSPVDGKAIKAADKIIFPYRCVGKAIARNWQISAKQAVSMPWDVPVPITSSPVALSGSEITVLLPLYDSQAQRTNMGVFDMLQRVLHENKHVRAIIASGARWTLHATRAVRRMRKVFSDRLSLVAKPNNLRRISLLGNADLTIWPAHYESFGLVGLSSLCMGTPVIAWDIPPQTEYLRNNVNSVLVPCEIRTNWLGVPEVLADYKVFGDHLLALLQDKARLATINTGTTTDLENRREQFVQGWKAFCI